MGTIKNVDNIKERIFTALRDGDTYEAEEVITEFFELEEPISVTDTAGTIHLNGECSSKKEGNNLLRKLHSLFQDTYIIHAHGLNMEDGQVVGYYMNLIDRVR